MNAIGRIIREEWLRAPEIRPSIALPDLVVMPNHLRGIIVIMPDTRATQRVAPTIAPRITVTERPAMPRQDS